MRSGPSLPCSPSAFASASRTPLRRGGARRRLAFTLIELVVLLAVLALLVALILPAVFAARESSRRVQCTSHLQQLGIAVNAFESAHGMFPPGTGFSLHARLLPYLDQQPLSARIDYSREPHSGENREIGRNRIPAFVCPSDPSAHGASSSGGQATNYAGNFGTGVQKYGYNGMFRPLHPWTDYYAAGPIRAMDVKDGLSHTALLSEILVGDDSRRERRTNWNTPDSFAQPDELEQFAEYCSALPTQGLTGDWKRGWPWTRGGPGATLYNHVLTPNQKSCYNGTGVQIGIFTAASQHAGGVNVLYGDGRVAFTADSIDRRVWRAAGSRDGGEIVHQ